MQEDDVLIIKVKRGKPAPLIRPMLNAGLN